MEEGEKKNFFWRRRAWESFFPKVYFAFFPSSVRARGGGRRHVGGTDFRPVVVSQSTGKLVLEKQFGDIC